MIEGVFFSHALGRCLYTRSRRSGASRSRSIEAIKLLASNGKERDNFGTAWPSKGIGPCRGPETDHSGQAAWHDLRLRENGRPWIETAQLIPTIPGSCSFSDSTWTSAATWSWGVPTSTATSKETRFEAPSIFSGAREEVGAGGQAEGGRHDVHRVFRVQRGRGRRHGPGQFPRDPAMGDSTGAVYVSARWAEPGRGSPSSTPPTPRRTTISASAWRSAEIRSCSFPGDDDLGSSSGSAYVFREIGGVFTQIASSRPRKAPRPTSSAQRVDPGIYRIIGSIGTDNGIPSSNRGSAYVFEEIDGVWTQIAKLTAFESMSFDFLGRRSPWTAAWPSWAPNRPTRATLTRTSGRRMSSQTWAVPA